MDYSSVIAKIFEQSAKVVSESKTLSKDIQLAVENIIICLKAGKKLVIFGNGGSAADAQHMAAEFVGRYMLERQSLPAISLTTDTSILTALGNDYGFNMVFSRQCESLVCEGDIVIAISTSGKSKNIIEGIHAAKKRGGMVVSLTGKGGGKLRNISDITISVNSDDTPRIQEAHRTIIHIMCDLVEKNLHAK